MGARVGGESGKRFQTMCWPSSSRASLQFGAGQQVGAIPGRVAMTNCQRSWRGPGRRGAGWIRTLCSRRVVNSKRFVTCVALLDTAVSFAAHFVMAASFVLRNVSFTFALPLSSTVRCLPLGPSGCRPCLARYCSYQATTDSPALFLIPLPA
jgi:hypothetical protein